MQRLYTVLAGPQCQRFYLKTAAPQAQRVLFYLGVLGTSPYRHGCRCFNETKKDSKQVKTKLEKKCLKPQLINYRRASNEGSMIEGDGQIKDSVLDVKTFSALIRKFKQLEKQPNHKDLMNELKTAKSLEDLFLKKSSTDSLKIQMVENLNAILNFYDIFNAQKEFANLVAKMESHKLVNEATYFLIIKNEAKRGPWQNGLNIINMMKEKNVELHARTYQHVIIKAVKNGDLNDALTLLREMKELEYIFHDDFYGSLVYAAMEKDGKSKVFVLKILDHLENTGFVLGAKSFGALMEWFKRDKSKRWKVGTALVNIKGTCKCCGSQLKKFSLPEERRLDLQQKLQNIAEKAILNSNGIPSCSALPDFSSTYGSGTASKINDFKHYMDVNGPFDIALDVLNVAYYRDRGFNSFQVKRVVRHFAATGKRILALCSSPLVSSLLEMEVAPDLPNTHMIQLLHYLRRQECGIFFVDDRKEDGHIDDYFILLSMIYHNMEIDVITADKFGDHVHSLDSITKWNFYRWMKAHQIILKKFTDTGIPIFKRREDYDTDVQHTKDSWHLPGPNRQWLCCTKR